jgi:hypothetical protein
LNAAGTAWEQVVGGASPINEASNREAREPSLTSIGGVPSGGSVVLDQRRDLSDGR